MILVSAIALAACSGRDGDTADDAPATVDPAVTVDTAPALTTSEVAVPETAPPAIDALSEAVFSFFRDDLCEWVTEEAVVEMVSAEYPRIGSAELEETNSSRCHWRLTGDAGESGVLSAGDASEWVTFAAQVDAESFWASGHPELSDGVLVHHEGWGQLALWVPPREEYLAFAMLGPGEQGPGGDEQGMALADAFLHELGWIPTTT
jgi:hypothetical protein